jgi:hypothetical protein
MGSERFTVIDDGRPVEVTALLTGDRLWLPAADLGRALGFALRAEGLCRDGLCVPRRAGPAAGEQGIDLADLAETLDRPLALDVAEHAACLGVSATERAGALASLTAPDFSLPDLEGRAHALSEHRGKKVLLVAYASW